MREDIVSYSITDDLTKETIVEFYNIYNKIVEPHGAVGWASLQIFRDYYPENNHYKAICFETADPAKFPEEIISLINITPKIPDSLKIIQNKKELANLREIGNYQDFKKLLIEEFSK